MFSSEVLIIFLNEFFYLCLIFDNLMF